MEQKGVWRTIMGRRIFIADGQDVRTAIRNSNKFSKNVFKTKSKAKSSHSGDISKEGKQTTRQVKIDHKQDIKRQVLSQKDKRLNDWAKEKINNDFQEKKPNGENWIKPKDFRMTESGKPANSIAMHCDKNGNLTPERERVHKEIIAKIIGNAVPAKDGEQTIYFSGGGAATGKSGILNNPEKFMGHDKNNTVVVDPDAIKAMFPDYLNYNDMDRAGFFHEESSALAKRITSILESNHYNTFMDGVNDSTAAKMIEKIDEARAHGYKVKGAYIFRDTEECVKSNLNRALKLREKGLPARLVPLAVLLEGHAGCSKIFEEIAPHFDSVKLYDQRKFKADEVASCERGKKLKIKNQEAFDFFKSKADFDLTGADLDRYEKLYKNFGIGYYRRNKNSSK